jgi:hemolysin activation/secretion protein
MREGLGTWVVIALLWCLPIEVIAQDTLQQIRFEVERFDVVGDNPIGERAQAVLAPYVGEQYGLEGLSAARDALEQAIINAGYNFHRVSLPPQELLEGVVLLRVSRFVIGKIDVEGNEFFDDDNILNSVPVLQAGETPNTQLLSRSLKIANKSASKSTVLRFSEGTEADSIDALLSVTDRNPQVFFVSLDNTGPEDGETWRSTFGYQHGNLFNRDHAVTATLTTAPEDTSATLQIGINYNIPLYEHGASIDLLFSDSDSAGETGGGTDGSQGIAPGTGGGQALEITGEGRVYGFIYSRPLLTDSSYSHDWTVGLQHKNFDNSSKFGEEELEDISPNVISVPLEVGYAFNRRTPGNAFFGNVRLVQEVGDDDSEYQRDRLGAESGWTALRYNLSYDLLFAEEYLFSTRFSGQHTNALLISGEQFGLGGEATLRGFEERSVTGDSGYQLSLELWFPPVFNDMRFLVFTDIGHTEYNDGTEPGTEGVEFDPSSAGLGMFWAWKESLSVSLNYGYIIEGGGLDTEINQDGDSKLHVSAVYRF